MAETESLLLDAALRDADQAVLRLAKLIRKNCPVCQGHLPGLGHVNNCAVLAAEWREAHRA